MQHIERLSCATRRVPLGMKGQLSFNIKFDRVKIAFILELLYWLKPLTDEGGEETGAPRENLWWPASENATY